MNYVLFGLTVSETAEFVWIMVPQKKRALELFGIDKPNGLLPYSKQFDH